MREPTSPALWIIPAISAAILALSACWRDLRWIGGDVVSAHWTVEENSNYSDDPLSGWVIRYDPTPGGRKNEDGTTSYSMTAPALAITSWIGDLENAANEVARDLNEIDTLRAENERLRNAGNAIRRWAMPSGLDPEIDADMRAWDQLVALSEAQP